MSSSQEEPENKKPRLFVAYSGGATGADAVWTREVVKTGSAVHVMSFKFHKPTVPVDDLVTITQLTPEELAEGDKNTRRSFNRSTQSPFVTSLLQRNYHIVKNAEAVYAIGKMIGGDDRAIEGGTGWGCEVAKIQEKPLFFFDLNTLKWLKYTETEWQSIERPPLLTEYTSVGLIGSRDLGEAGEKEIVELVGAKEE